MTDVAVSTSDSFATKLGGAAVDDTMVMGAGEHLTNGTGTTRQDINKRVVIRAAAYDAATWEGKFVRDATGHLKADYPSQWRGGWDDFASGVIVRGMLLVGRMTGGGGSVHILANSVVFEDCGLTDDFGYIMAVVGETTQLTSVVFRRCRFWNIGARADHDHPIYWKATTGTGATRCMAEDCIFYNHTGWAMHAYPNGDAVLYKRCLVYRGNGAGVFSAEGATASTDGRFENCLLLDAQGYGVGGFESGANPRYLVENLGGGSGTVQDTMAVNNSPGPGVEGVIDPTGVTKVNVLETGIPLWLNGPPETTGDFRLDPNPSNPALGYGPTYIQPSTSTVDTTGGNLSISVISGRSGKRTIGSHSSIVVPTLPFVAVHFANDPDRVTPGS